MMLLALLLALGPWPTRRITGVVKRPQRRRRARRPAVILQTASGASSRPSDRPRRPIRHGNRRRWPGHARRSRRPASPRTASRSPPRRRYRSRARARRRSSSRHRHPFTRTSSGSATCRRASPSSSTSRSSSRRLSSPTMCCGRFRPSACSAAPAASSAHPTAQGVSLRGIGPSGVSRTLVLIDNVPFNDPFGGWVYWTRVPLENVERIEVVEGPELEPVRQLRMGGVINIVSGRPRAGAPSKCKPQFGNLDQPQARFLRQRRVGQAGRRR